MIQKDVLRLAELGRGMETGLRLEPKLQKGFKMTLKEKDLRYRTVFLVSNLKKYYE